MLTAINHTMEHKPKKKPEPDSSTLDKLPPLTIEEARAQVKALSAQRPKPRA